MFFTGTIQEAVATALRENKFVVNFVTDEQEVGQQWENEWLHDPSLVPFLRDESVVLRLKAGSVEAGFLANLYPIPKFPTIIIIKDRDLKGYVAPDCDKEKFLLHMTVAFQKPPRNQNPSQAQITTTSEEASAVPQQASTPNLATQTPSNAPQESRQSQQEPPTSDISSSSGGPPTPSQEEEPAANLRAVLAERRARLEARRREAERKAKEARAAKAAAEATDSSPEAVQKRLRAEALRKEREKAAEERARILRRIQDDKLDRQARAAASREPKLGDVAAALATVASTPLRPSTGQVALQVRLFDGSSLRTRFSGAKATLGNDVRKWLDESRTDDKVPYVFKLVRPPPQPSQRIDETEEGKTLAELGLVPSATLMLAPVRKHAQAYDARRRGFFGLLFALFGQFIGFLAWLWGLMTGVFSGSGGGSSNSGGSSSNNISSSSSSGGSNRDHENEESRKKQAEAQAAQVRERRSGRFAQFANPEDRRGDQQLYNGNSLNFEPRPDDEQ
ncbi:hypothetical protein SODALDRAFT_334788 [Sodiomyces alkalinus F11]|uniref:UBX domain-containing protein 2 n=1 Tax=Sodiomyces alkalinus (strain CBS 110278 / VKM F-3762 / F11) TaxID=1314773 RepID=A0A3N2PT17_SODAK|nr:hypothetical protein SODALDRAFT_334788 [Sodiomyces alkalinus F11]ROT37669.1 hypothetical protein SODALDRAFT_334788 [Sodiomyces alkalinus F11]